MSVRQKLILFGVALIIIIIVIIAVMLNRGATSAATDSAIDEDIRTPVFQNNQKTPAPTPISIASVQAAIKHLPPEEQMSRLLEQTYSAIDTCQRALKEKLPKNLFEGDMEVSPIRDISSVYEALGTFYETMTEKNATLNVLEGFVDAHLDKDVDYNKFAQKLSDKPVQDCGDYEEHSLLQLVIDAADDNDWTPSQKKALAGYIIDKFKSQLDQNPNTLSLAVKTGILKDLIDEGFIPERYGEEIKELMDNTRRTREELMNSVPVEARRNKNLSKYDFYNIREEEKKGSKKLKDPLKELLNNMQMDE